MLSNVFNTKLEFDIKMTLVLWVSMLYLNTVRPRLYGHIGTGTYPEKRFGRIWEFCLNRASSVGFIRVHYYNVFTHYKFVSSYRLYKMK